MVLDTGGWEGCPNKQFKRSEVILKNDNFECNKVFHKVHSCVYEY